MERKRIIRLIIWTTAVLFILINIVAYLHAYKFTHFTDVPVVKTAAEKLSTVNKLQALLFGINNPRPKNNRVPTQKFRTIKLQSNAVIECWYIKADSSKGTIILFHGYGGQKSSLIEKSDEFIKHGYSTLMVDFMGSGGSEGNSTTIGFKEAEEVKTCFRYLQDKGETSIYLFGTSMGAVSIMKSIRDYKFNPRGIILECPFGSMYQTTCARFKILKVPSFPFAALLVFWGGIQNGFWAFGHNPTKYAKSIHCPVLLLYGEQDDRVSRKEIDDIYTNLSGSKTLKTYPLAGHTDYFTNYKQQWLHDVTLFLHATRK